MLNHPATITQSSVSSGLGSESRLSIKSVLSAATILCCSSEAGLKQCSLRSPLFLVTAPPPVPLTLEIPPGQTQLLLGLCGIRTGLNPEDPRQARPSGPSSSRPQLRMAEGRRGPQQDKRRSMGYSPTTVAIQGALAGAGSPRIRSIPVEIRQHLTN